ncbi:unnamed protein product [Leptidea sinapis]|uniref:Uncharacterized protein n=1 Tax=Leptidea sinapis TaxID=189913 RepID=A0A5E4R7T3_9NEOP|nr:unnamed protein product [Leptidea sinapis]
MLAVTLVGVAFVAICCADQSGLSGSQPISVKDGTPEVVLQLKYDGGELNRIYLTQFRKELSAATTAVPASGRLCTDLCYAGLGGEGCGPGCSKLVPIGLKTALSNVTDSGVQYGEPRIEVCPALCANRLVATNLHTNWTSVCDAFCDTDGYVLQGCPLCDTQKNTSEMAAKVRMFVDTVDGWQAWCNVQCRQGRGGAACNCDRTPF